MDINTSLLKHLNPPHVEPEPETRAIRTTQLRAWFSTLCDVQHPRVHLSLDRDTMLEEAESFRQDALGVVLRQLGEILNP